jgi:hypothetical protein
LRRPDRSNARIGQRRKILTGTVSREVIDDDEFEIWLVLRYDAFYRSRQKRSTIMSGEDDRDFWRRRHA